MASVSIGEHHYWMIQMHSELALSTVNMLSSAVFAGLLDGHTVCTHDLEHPPKNQISDLLCFRSCLALIISPFRFSFGFSRWIRRLLGDALVLQQYTMCIRQHPCKVEQIFAIAQALTQVNVETICVCCAIFTGCPDCSSAFASIS